ncbi:hypothetical protein Amsp01_012760 [Amycolatopsis sp. NBRC 101858]|uniref:hypothetical protein n=1 Tax=unclassified Amycolatopsis TaxID=2618356 RepID=UPI001FF1B905|nr:MULTISPECIES: hypothetical protein [unclassified Amycolatopsis]UOX91346.1 hypothetical protein MUY14_12225 [Amycolatopsis sp. FBCC-B4732]GLY35252.1 hypothetical protein Amsp01_012760 [Amycolatopsis sp. NBRC 101858]
MPEIQAIITAASDAYRAFVATEPDRDIRVAVGNAVRFLAADLTSAAELVAATREG